MRIKCLTPEPLLRADRRRTDGACVALTLDFDHTNMDIDPASLRAMRDSAITGKKRCVYAQKSSAEYATRTYGEVR